MKNVKYSEIRALKYWVQKVLPLVYDDSLSYLEVLDKVKWKLNEVIEQTNSLGDDVSDVTDAVNAIDIRLQSLEDGTYDDIIKQYIAEAVKGVWFGLTQTGYFVAYIPDSWENIEFNTTGYDIELELEPEYGHLVLSY